MVDYLTILAKLLKKWITLLHELKLKEAVQEKPNVCPGNVYITPIALNHTIINYGKPCSRRDWDEQIEEYIKGEQVMWDGPPLNEPQPGSGDLL